MNRARQKVEDEGRCRICGTNRGLEAAHIIARSSTKAARGYDDPDNIVPLCREHHQQFDLRQLDVLPVLSFEEQARAVELVGLERARKRVAPTLYQHERKGAT